MSFLNFIKYRKLPFRFYSCIARQLPFREQLP
nr:MAG TPA: hypothetical protein [Caudoviricetes sp.]